MLNLIHKRPVQGPPFRRSGEPLRVQICKTSDDEIKFYTEMNLRLGHVLYVKDKWLCVDVLNHGNFYRSPSAVFDRMEDGTYLFDKEGRISRVA